jgi:pimeloyl-ACP methyl ester carboxylesterase
MDFLLKRTDIDRNKIIVFGRSLGGAVAVNLAFQPFYARHIAVLMLENTFTSLPDIGRTIFDFPILQYLPDILFKAKVSMKFSFFFCMISIPY